MKSLIVSLALILSVSSSFAADQNGMPEVNVIKTVALTGQTYENPTATGAKLFLSKHSLETNRADLELAFWSEKGPIVVPDSSPDSGFASMMSDLGILPLEEINGRKLVLDGDKQRQFQQYVILQVGHSYAINLSTHSARGFYMFKVEDADPKTKTLILSYAVSVYETINPINEVYQSENPKREEKPEAKVASQEVELKSASKLFGKKVNYSGLLKQPVPTKSSRKNKLN
ncbi:hypothetical protein [Bdellovibrio sp. NC01]|uniref:hypothetical protein n=1 Tax=Bdellovibrio sp. NC01 TaxID=2220073 RepID=UPI00115AA9CA|nr:hypothetical protein [Bdellovibrio sp. NC01]QDK37938.1 hypothetical protein DOE51_10245 [Bdellovibrio sp. NC01]